ncbi:MAG: response regulator [Dehalococcoidales bacterium]|nr:response regulator [Dehalococcoidales bacterium]
MDRNQKNILIVDDEQAIRQLLQRKLTALDYRCEAAATADEALSQMNDEPAALVILDINMPGMSGVELLAEIKAIHPDTAVIMATAVTKIDTAIHCMKQGAYDYISKPFNLDQVVLSIERAFEKRGLELENRDYQQHLEHKVEQQASKIRESFMNSITAMVYALEAKDKYTSGHSQRVAEISVAIAREMGLSRQMINDIRLAGLIHDIGKIGIRASILNKPDRLTDTEFEHIRAHPEIGEHIMTPIVEDRQILKIVRHHHERHDGNGYPDRLSGGQIPLGARILAIADAYDAITSERPYRQAMNPKIAKDIIKRCEGSQFDPEVADAFLNINVSITA